MRSRAAFLRIVLLTNGIVDLLCAAVLLILPRLNVPLLGYDGFDAQGAFMAGGWGVSTLALGVTRIYASTRPETYGAMLLLGVVEGICLAVFCMAYLLGAKITITQALLPLMVGLIFGVSYLICAVGWRRTEGRYVLQQHRHSRN
jgi:uncharacterized membrane protein